MVGIASAGLSPAAIAVLLFEAAQPHVNRRARRVGKLANQVQSRVRNEEEQRCRWRPHPLQPEPKCFWTFQPPPSSPDFRFGISAESLKKIAFRSFKSAASFSFLAVILTSGKPARERDALC